MTAIVCGDVGVDTRQMDADAASELIDLLMIILSRRDMSAAYSTMFYCTVARSECWHVAEVVGYCSLVLAVNHSFFDDIKYRVTCMRHRRRIPDVIARALYIISSSILNTNVVIAVDMHTSLQCTAVSCV